MSSPQCGFFLSIWTSCVYSAVWANQIDSEQFYGGTGMFVRSRALHILVGLGLSFAILICWCTVNVQAENDGSKHDGVIYKNPRVYNVDFSFELVPDPNRIDRAKDLKLWIPIPREWDSQKAVKIISVEPEPHSEYNDPEHGNQMLFWDFGKGPERPSYKVDIKYRLESYEVHAKVDPEHIEPYDKTSKEYALYTRSTHAVSITPKIREMAQEAVGDEKNAYLQAKRIFEFVRKKMRYKIVRHERGSGVDCLLDFPVTDQETGDQYYEGACGQQSVFFISLCRAIGIPARGVTGMGGWSPWIKEKDLELSSEILTKLTPDGLAAARIYGLNIGHIWAEFYLPGYGWIPVDPTAGMFNHQVNNKLIFSKGRDIKIGPYAPQEESEGYGDQWIPIHKGRADVIGWGVWNIAKIRIAKIKIHHSAPFPIVKYLVYLCSTTGFAILTGGLAGYICLHKFKKYALIGLTGVVPFVGLALPIVFVTRERQIKCSKVSFVMLFWIFSIFLLWLLLFPVMVETDLISWSAWQAFCAIVVCILAVLGGWILVGFLCRKSWIKNRLIRVIVKTILFGVFWIVSACMLGVWVMSSFT